MENKYKPHNVCGKSEGATQHKAALVTKIEPVALAITEVCLSRSSSQLVSRNRYLSQSVGIDIFLKFHSSFSYHSDSTFGFAIA